MKIVKVIDSVNGQVEVYEDDTYVLKKPYRRYEDLVNDRVNMLIKLIDSGFTVTECQLCLGGSKKKGIVFYLYVTMLYS